jgi:lysophospholipase L1-like esterase
VSILWTVGSYVDLTSVALDSGATLATATRPSSSIVLAGDSITQGFNATKPSATWTQKVADAQSRKAFHVGYGSAPTLWLDSPRMLATVPTADLGTYMIGINDAASQVPLALYSSNLRNWLIKAKATMSDPRLFMCSPIFYTAGTTPITVAQYRTEAKNTVEGMIEYATGDSKLFYLDGLALMPSNASGLADGVHPNDLGSAEIATNVNAAMNVTAPAAPSNLQATVISSSQIDLSWTDNASNETGTIIQRRYPASTGIWQQVGIRLAGTTTFSDTGLAASSQYEYRVCAYNAGGSSAFATAVTATTSAGTSNRIRVLVVGGGGGGGDAGGGGSGGYRHDAAFVATPGTTYNVVVGAGGAAGGVGARGTSGVDSSFSTITAAGGGGGGAFSNTLMDGINGGSGGGAGASISPAASGAAGAGNTPTTSPSQGNNGGTSQTGTWSFGGGGGAGAVGQNGNNMAVVGNQGGYGGQGGDGAVNNIRGVAEVFAGGGGGGGWGTGGAGGRGGGGDGRCFAPTTRNPVAGSTNVGGGGGGGFGSGGGGAAGGSGIVILRMPTSEYTGITTGSPAVTTSGGDTILTFTGSGSYKA